MWSDFLVFFCDCGFHSPCLLLEKDRRLVEASWWERLTEGETGCYSDGGAMLSKSLIQFSIDRQGCVLSLLFDLRPTSGGGNEDNGNLFKRSLVPTAALSAPNPAASHCQLTPPPETPDTHRQVWFSLLWGHWSFSWVLVCTRFSLCPPRVCFPSFV